MVSTNAMAKRPSFSKKSPAVRAAPGVGGVFPSVASDDAKAGVAFVFASDQRGLAGKSTAAGIGAGNGRPVVGQRRPKAD